MKDIGGKLTAAGKTIMPLSAAVVGIGTAAAVSAVDFEDAMAKVSTIADTTEVPLDELRSQILLYLLRQAFLPVKSQTMYTMPFLPDRKQEMRLIS